MKEFKRRIVILFTVFICAVFAAGGWYFIQKNADSTSKTDQFIQDREALLRLLQNSSEIHRIWNQGEDSREWSLLREQCLNYYQITTKFDESLMRCQPMLIQCLAMFDKKLNYHLVKPEIGNEHNQKLYRYLTKSSGAHVGIKNTGFLFTLEDNLTHKRLDLFLENQCQEVFLENRAYAYGEELEGKAARGVEDYRFDNFGQNIYLDRHLVTNAEINEWIDFANPDFTRGLTKKEGNNLFLPETHLNYSQMEDYCSFSGKQVMLAHYFDAATFVPMELNVVLPKNNHRSPYYWTKKKSDYKADCSLLYAEECLKKKPYQLNATNPSWAGIMDSMGGVFEVFRNSIDPESNLKASSFYFNFKSPWHKLGFRAGWDGEGFELRNFDFKGINPEVSIDKFQVGFRCMRESR